MQLHQLQPKHKKKQRKRVGRGGKRGTYSGKGIKGQSARAGRKLQPMIRQFIKRYPKKRGYQFASLFEKPAIVNIGLLNNKFEKETTISPETLLKKGLIRKIKGKVPRVKILGKGKIEKAIIIERCELSKSAKEKIEKAGGHIK